MADEVSESFTVIRTLLAANLTLQAALGASAATFRCYAADQVPALPIFPYILVDYATGDDVQGLGGVRLLTKPLMLVRLVNRGPIDATLRSLDKAMDTVLQNISRQISNGYVISCERVRPHRLSYQDEANNKFNETGGMYRFHVSKQ